MSGHQENKIWYDDLPGFFTYDNYFVILPTVSMSIEEKLNAIVRFFIYLGVFLSLVRADYRYLFLGIIAAIVSIAANEYEISRHKKAEKFLKKNNLLVVDNKVCSRSTVDNPFMNPMITDITTNPNHPEACNLEDAKVKETVDSNFYSHMFRDVSDLYGKKASQRQFYTMPVTTIPGDQKGFGEWLYNRGPSCKEGNGNQCWRNVSDLSRVIGGSTGGPAKGG